MPNVFENWDLGERDDFIRARAKSGRRTVSVSAETVIVIVFVDTVTELVTGGAVTLIITIRDRNTR